MSNPPGVSEPLIVSNPTTTSEPFRMSNPTCNSEPQKPRKPKHKSEPLKKRTPFYREIYDKAKLRENEKLGNPIENPKNCSLHEECAKRINQKAKRTKTSPKKLPCKMHVHNRAMRKMVKRFLADLWVAWRRFEGLPVSEPYAIAILGHNQETH